MKQPIFIGSSAAIVTPFDDGGINFDCLSRLIEMHISSGTSALTVCGTTGESPTLFFDEHIKLIDFCVAKSAGRIKIIAGSGSNNTETSLEYCLHAQASGADGVLLVTPYYNKTTQNGLIDHYTYIADRISVPIILYNVPSRTGMSITPESYKVLSGHPMINGVKEASGSFQLISDTIDLCGDELNIWSGNDCETIPMMALGAKGVISVAANIIPVQMSQITGYCNDGNYDLACQTYYKYASLISALFCEVNPIPIKSAMNIAGFDVGAPRRPLCNMSEKNLLNLRDTMIKCGIV